VQSIKIKAPSLIKSTGTTTHSTPAKEKEKHHGKEEGKCYSIADIGLCLKVGNNEPFVRVNKAADGVANKN